MKKTIKSTKVLLLALLIITTFSCKKDDDPISINLQNLEVTVDENPTVGQVIGTVQSDSNSSLTFSIASQTPNGAIEINESTGELSVADATLFDYETNPTITATVTAVEAENIATVTITVNNTNELSVQDFTVTIDENPTNGDAIGTVQASGDATLTYSITSQTPAGALSIDTNTGELTVADAALFDYETNPTITATISVDNSGNIQTLSATINLNDVNELSVQDFVTTIDENPTNGQSLGTVQASGDATLSFSITSQTPAGALNIDVATGELTVADATLFDYETNPTITATISVDNSGNMQTAIAAINLNDIDNIAALLSVSLSAYNTANMGDWIEITEAEYNNLANTLSQITKAGTTDAEYNGSSIDVWASQNYSRANKTVTSTVPNNGYIFAFKYKAEEATNVTGIRVKQSVTGNNIGFSDLGNPLPAHSGTMQDVFFVLKGSNSPLTSTGYLGFFQSDSKVSTFANTEGSYFTSANASNIGTGPVGYKLFYQGLCTTQAQW